MSDHLGSIWNETFLRETIISELAIMTGRNASEINSDQTFDEYGLDSTDAVLAAGMLEERLGVELPPELLLQNDTVGKVVAALIALRSELPS